MTTPQDTRETRATLDRARELILEKQYGRARAVLEPIAAHPKAQEWLRRLADLDPQPQTMAQAQQEINELRQEMRQAEADVGQAERRGRRGNRVSTALLVFFGTLVGSLLGAVADFGEALNTFERFRAFTYPRLCMVGSDTVLGEGLGLSTLWVEGFTATHDVRFDVRATGSVRGVEAAANGECAQLLAMSEPMTAAQQEQLRGAGVEIECAAEVGYDIIVFVTDINNPVRVVDRQSMAAALLGNITTWSEISRGDYPYPITILARPGSGTTDVVLQNVANRAPVPGGAFPPGAPYEACDSNEACLDETLSTPGALYWASLAWMRTQPPEYLRVLAMLQGDEGAINPLQDTAFNLADYPAALQRPLYLYVLQSSDTSDAQLAEARAFFTYARGLRGQQALAASGFYPHFNRPPDVDITLPQGFTAVGETNRQFCRSA